MGELLQEGPAAGPAAPTPTSYLPECCGGEGTGRRLTGQELEGSRHPWPREKRRPRGQTELVPAGGRE